MPHLPQSPNVGSKHKRNLVMTQTDWTGFIGVTILLVAYFLNLREVIKKESLMNLLLNVFGAAIACFAFVLLKYFPF